MEIDVKKQEAQLKEEIAQLTSQLNQVNQQIASFQQQANNLTALVLKKMGALELLQGLDGKEPVK